MIFTLLRNTHTYWAMLAAALVLTNCATATQRDAARADIAELRTAEAKAQSQLRELSERYRAAEHKLLADISTTRKDADEKVSAARATAADLRSRMRDIANRPTAGGLVPPPGGLAAFATPAGGADGPVVLGTLGEADVSEAERADVIRLELLACYANYDAARNALGD